MDGGGLGIGSLLERAQASGTGLLEKALAIDDALGAWEDQVEAKVTAKAQEKAADIISLVASGEIGACLTSAQRRAARLPPRAVPDDACPRIADEDELDLPVEEQLSRQRRKGRDLKSQLELSSGKIRAVEASRDELDGALKKARDDIAARDATAKELDAKLADYAEMIPKRERKMEDERREEEAVRKRQQAEEVGVIQAMADEMVAETRRELALERDAKATVEFAMSQSFEAKARAKEDSAEMLEAESQKYRLMLPALQASNTELTNTVARLRERETERMQAAIEAEKSANQLGHELADAKAALQRANESRSQLEGSIISTKAQLEREQQQHADELSKYSAKQARLEKENHALQMAESGGEQETDGYSEFDSVELALIRELQATKKMVVDYRVQLSERQQQVNAIALEWGGAKTLLQQREALITQLEAHLEAAIGGEGGIGGSTQLASDAVGLTAVEGAGVGGTEAAAAPGGGASSGTSSAAVLEVVSGQRDRLRARVQQLEEEAVRLEGAAKDAKLAASKAIKEQDALRQRLRYVQSSSAASPSSSGPSGAGSAVDGGGGGGRSATLRLPAVDPFKEFAQKYDLPPPLPSVLRQPWAVLLPRS